MPHSFKLSRRLARFRAPLFASLIVLAGCDNSNSLNPEGNAPATDPGGVIEEESPVGVETAFEDDTPVGEDLDGAMPAPASPAASVSFAGGIPIGTFAMPTEKFGSVHNGAHRNIWPELLLSHLSGIKARGGKVALMMAGSEQYYKDASGNFSLTKWKARVDRFRKVNFNAYVTDGTVIGHYLIDEPHDPKNWNGRPVSASTLEEMARYSKSIWPNMVTIVREVPSYLLSNHRYLDAAWAQYTSVRGDPTSYVKSNASSAQSKGLALIVGLNILKGGPNKSKMSPTQIKTWGSALLTSTYPCAFISWTWNSTYLQTSGVVDAMKYLRSKAQNRSFKTCRG